MSDLVVGRCRLREAQDFVRYHHRHLKKPPIRALACFALLDGDDAGPLFGARVVGVAMLGRPVARCLDDGTAAEVTRVAVLPGVPNGCSMLIGACARWAKRRGYETLVT